MFTVIPETIKALDDKAVSDFGIGELTLMKTAAKNAYEAFKYLLCPDSKITILCGKGNNGGDGYEIANILKGEWLDVTVVNVFDTAPNSNAAKTVYDECIKNGVKIINANQGEEAINRADIILDAIFGVGFYGSIDSEGSIGKLVCECNNSTAFKIAVDVPSGINSADGRVEGICFEADMTVTMAYLKTGMLSYPARQYCGEIAVAQVGYPKELCDMVMKDALVPDEEYIKKVIPVRKQNTHKGTYGRLLMYVGNENMIGAAVLSAEGALRSGVGLVNVVNNKETVRILQNHLLEPVFSCLDEGKEIQEIAELACKAGAILIGCGMGQKEKNKQLLYHLIKNANCRIIIDADGINCLSSNINILKEAKFTPIITPHPLEFARLVQKDVDSVQSDRINNARSFAKEYNCVVVLKGAGTVVAAPDGRLGINTTGGPELSKGGSGDVLAGVISSFVSQGIDVFDAAVSGVYLHGRAGDVLREEISSYGVLPRDLPKTVAKLLP